ncbi:hypothetical protein WJX74_006911 [Apatococcus lobatus]|uniref:Uncharacterized protein n=1 Tax=Apatococcus lobatus TaxID=904363 RepID=A0AAW1RHV2_9CHLO
MLMSLALSTTVTVLLCLLGFRKCSGASAWTLKGKIVSGEHWLDDEGGIIQAHGGSMLFHNQTYFWYGENKDAPTEWRSWKMPDQEWWYTRTPALGISCYSSSDLLNWHNEGMALKADGSHEDLEAGQTLERPRVLYNNLTQQFVMWVHVDDAGYSLCRLGMAVSAAPTGPFRYQGSMQANDQRNGDFTLFKEDNGTAYVVTASQKQSMDPRFMLLHELSIDFQRVLPNPFRILPPLDRESPVLFKYEAHYFLLTSGSTFWSPNAAEIFTARALEGPYASWGNPCHGEPMDQHGITFSSQASFAIPLQAPGAPGHFLIMADRWQSNDLKESTYVWLPLHISLRVQKPLQLVSKSGEAANDDNEDPGQDEAVRLTAVRRIALEWRSAWDPHSGLNLPGTSLKYREGRSRVHRLPVAFVARYGSYIHGPEPPDAGLNKG